MTNEATTKPAPACKFQPGQTVYRVEKGRYNRGYRIPSLNVRIKLTKTTVKTSRMVEKRLGGWGQKKTAWWEMISFENSYTEVHATRAAVLTEAQYELVREEYEAAVTQADESRLRALAIKRAYVSRAVDVIAGEVTCGGRDDLIQAIMDGHGPLVPPNSPGLTCTVCWLDHGYYHQPDHEPVYVTP